MQYFEERGAGVNVGVGVVPIVPAAVIFDLAVGDPAVRPGKREGYHACMAASADLETGRVGAGTGATVGKAYGVQYAMRAGLGTACVELENGVKVAALAVVNAFGDVYDPATGEIVAGAQKDGKFLDAMNAPALNGLMNLGNTTIGVVATNATLTREEANKLASMAHDGLAMTVRPVHTSLDGDTFFALSTCEKGAYPLLPLLVAAVKAVNGAILDAVGYKGK
jgi:L-aminopeptidase/D-esterase-like protein